MWWEPRRHGSPEFLNFHRKKYIISYLIDDLLGGIREAIGPFPPESVEEHIKDDIHGNGVTQEGLKHEEDVDDGIEALFGNICRDRGGYRVTEAGITEESESRHETGTDDHGGGEDTSHRGQEIGRILQFILNW